MTDAIDPLYDDALFVRPPHERIPPALIGTQAGDVYGELVRWHDGADHAGRRVRVERFIEALDADRLCREAASAAGGADADAARYDVPLAVIARTIGIADAEVDRAVALVRAAARGMGPEATGDPAEAITAVPDLLAMLPDDAALDRANRLGLLLQTCDAVAGLIANTLARADAPAAGTNAVDPHAAAIAEVAATLRDDPPVRAARRFDHAGRLLAVDISDRPFGGGRHRCPGEQIARALAAGTVAGLRATTRR